MKRIFLFASLIGLTAATAGALFKFMHWPGASILFVSGHILLILMLLVWMFIRKRNTFKTLMALTLIVVMTNEVWIVMHWPYSRYTFGISIILVALLATMLLSGEES